MNTKKQFFISVFWLLFITGQSFSQVTADFFVDVPSGCSPLKVSFTNNSSGENLSYEWDFGNGNSSTTKDPQATYTTPGNYTVKLTVSDGVSFDETTAVITVFSNPVADFQGDTRGCTPLTSRFMDNSTEGDAPISEWKWDFRSGFIDPRQNPTHTYTTEGKYDVYLEVIDTNGCSGNIEKQEYVDVVNPPTSIFSFTPSVACEIPVVVNFTNNSSGKGNISYDWDFGDETISSEKSTSHTYNAYGDYAITLKVSSDYGCSTSTTKLFKVQDIQASGIISQDSVTIENDDNICPGMVNFEATTDQLISVLWVFGDGTTSTDRAGAHYYSEAGNYTVHLIAAPGEACADTISWSINVDEVIADFNFTPSYSCQSPVNVNFTNASTNAVSYYWEFHDNSTSGEENPVKEYVVPSEEDPYAVSSMYVFNTSLTIENENGCQASTTKSLTIKKPTARFKVDTLRGCKPLSVNFSGFSISEQPITNREWIFGDGTITNGNDLETVHTYNTEGVYDAQLVITNGDGCTDTSYTMTINVGKPLSPDFEIVPAEFCQNEEIRFTNPKHIDQNIDQWHYSIGGISVPLDPYGDDTTWQAKLNQTGELDAILEINYNGCTSEIVKENYIISNGPIARFTSQMECDQPYTYQFEGVPENHTGFEWIFGDGNVNNSELNPMNVYGTEGDYPVEFVVTNAACSDTARKIIEVREPSALITGDTAVCAGDSVLFDGSGSYGIVNYCYEKYLWQFNDSTQPLRTDKDTAYHIFRHPGEYDVKLITQYDNQCKDTAVQKIMVYQPLVGFETDKTEGCAPILIQINDTSESNTHPLKSWYIDFGDGVDSTYHAYQDAFYHTYYNVGSYPITLSVTDTFGCTGSFTKSIYTANPSAAFSSLTSTETCAGNPIYFTHPYRESDSVLWNFGDGFLTNDTAKTLSHAYDVSGDFQVSLIVYQYGCTDTVISDPGYVKIQKADAHFAVNDSFFNCYPELVEFTHDGSPIDQISGGLWDFGYNNSTSEYAKTRQYTYPTPGKYTISLSIQTSYGCEDTYEKEIEVTGPRGRFSMSADAICRGEEVTLTLKDTSDVYSFEWDLGDGNFATGNPVKHRYHEMGDNIPKLILSGDSGKCLPPPVEDTLYVYELQAGFVIQNPAFCEESNILFTNTSFGHTDNKWNFSNGFKDFSPNVSSAFAPGDYNVDLIVSNPQGCTDTATRNFTVHPLPEIWVMPDTFVCAGQSASLRASGGHQVSWTPSNDITAPSSYETEAIPPITTSFLALVTDTTTGCTNQENVLVTVQQPPDISVSPADTSIIIGENVTFIADSLPGFSYQWSPESFFSCTNCATVHATLLETTTITLKVNDDMGCFSVPINIPVEVKQEYTVDLPSSFTPNGDGINDVVYVKGWGIKELIEFRVFNRWGNEVFFTDNLTEGWDGTYKGKLQNIDTYAYVVQAKTWEGQLVTKKGTITLLK